MTSFSASIKIEKFRFYQNLGVNILSLVLQGTIAVNWNTITSLTETFLSASFISTKVRYWSHHFDLREMGVNSNYPFKRT